MRYFVYSAMALKTGNSTPMLFSEVEECKSVFDLFKMAASQPEAWAITSYAEITREEYERWDG